MEEFTRNPSDPRYRGAANTADALRRQQIQEEKAYHRRQKRFYARMGRAGVAGRCTLTLIVISVVVLILKDGFSFGRSLEKMFFIAPYDYTLVFNPLSREARYKWEVTSPGLEPILHGEIWRLVTPIFLHDGIWHLVFNMWWLYYLGGAIERRRGQVRYLSLVLVLAIGSNLAQYFLGKLGSGESLASTPRSIFFGGMSGVVYGLFGYVWMKMRFQPELGLGIDRTNFILMIAWFFLCMTPWIHIFISGGVANAAHVAGLLMGMLIGYAPIMWQSLRSD